MGLLLARVERLLATVALAVLAARTLDALLLGINDQAHIWEGVHHRLEGAQFLPLLCRALADEDRVRFQRRQHVQGAALGVALVQGEQEGQHFVSRVGPEPDQRHQETGAPVLGKLGPGARRAAAGLSFAGQRVLPVLGVVGGELLVQRLEVRQAQATQARQSRRAGGDTLESDHGSSLHHNCPFWLTRNNSNQND